MKMKKIVALVSVAAFMITNFTAISVSTVSASVVTNADTSTEYSENFDSYGSKNSYDTQKTVLPGNGWYVANRTQLITDTNDNAYGYEIARLMTASGYNTSNCLRIIGGSTTTYGSNYYYYGYGKTFPGIAANEAATGSWEISFDFKAYLVSNKAQFAFSLVQADGGVTGDEAANNILACSGTDFYIGYNNFNTIKNNSVAQDILPAGEIGGTNWLTAKVYVNCEGKYYSVELYKWDGTLIARRSPISFVGDTISFLKFSAYNKDRASAVFVDNVSIKKVSKANEIYNETFDSFTDTSYRASVSTTIGGASEDITGSSYFKGFTPWRALTESGKDYGLENDTVLGSKVVRLGDDSETSGVTESSGLVYMPVYEKIVDSAIQDARGKLCLSFKIKPSIIGDSGFQLNTVPEYNSGTVTAFELADNAGNPAIVTNSGKTTLDASKWYDADVVFDAVNQKVTTTLKDHVTSAEVANFSRDIASLTAVKGIIFNAVGGTAVYMDDVNINYYSDNSSINPGDDNDDGDDEDDDDDDAETFESYNDDEKLLDDLMGNGWYLAGDTSLDADKSHYPADFVHIVNYEGRKCLQIKAPKRSENDEDIGIGRKFPGQGDANSISGSWEIKFKFHPYQSDFQFLFSMNTLDGSATGTNAQHSILAAYKGKMYLGHRDYMQLYNSNNPVLQGTLSGGSINLGWYDVKVNVNCDARYYSVEIYKGGKLVARRSPISFNGNATLGFLKLSALGLGKDNCVYIDDVSIKPALREMLIYKEDFEAFSSTALATTGMSLGGEIEDVAGSSYFEGFTPWRALTESGKDYGLENDAVLDSKVVRLGDDPGTSSVTESSGLVYMPAREGLLSGTAIQKARGKIRICFKVKPSIIGDSGFQLNAAPEYSSDIVTVFELADNSGNPAIVTDSGKVNLNASKWYDADVILDVVNKKATTILNDHSTSEEVINFSGALASLVAVKGIIFNAVGGTSVYMDDIKIEYDSSIDLGNVVELMEIDTVKIGDTLVNSLSGIKNKSTINVQIAYSNKSDTALDSLLFVAYYGDDMLLATSSVKPAAIGVGKKGIKSYNFTVPSSTVLDMKKVDKISLCLWKGFENSVPYCSEKDIENGLNVENTSTENASNSVSKPVVTYSYADSVLNISGTANENSRYLTVQILKPGNTFGAADMLESADADKLVFYRAQIPVENGKYSLDVRFDVKGNTESTLVAGDYPTAVYLDDAKLDIESVYLTSYQKYTDALTELNDAAQGDDFEEFKNVLNSKRSALNFNNKLLGNATLGDEIRPYFEYVKSNPLSAANEVNNSQMFNTYIVMKCLNNNEIESIDDINKLMLAEDIKTLCSETLTTNTKSRYFTGLLSKKNIGSQAGLEKSIKEALILTGAKFGNGYGELKKVLEACGSEIGIMTPISTEACRNLIGQTFRSVAEFKSAYDAAVASVSTPSASSSSSSKSSPSVSIPISEVNSSVPESKPIAKTFNDIDNFEWAMTAILALADRKIISGVAEDRFEPSRNITREEFAKILVEALGAYDDTYNENMFIDAKDSDWFVKYINIAAKLGIVKGMGNGRFGTGYNITRQDMAVMIYNALKYRNVNMKSGEFKFDDDGQIADYAKNAVDALHEMGAINGMTETSFAPYGLATRAQAARIVYSVLEELQGEGMAIYE